jgi:hypothetical protein
MASHGAKLVVCPLLPSKQVVTYGDAYGDSDVALESGGVLFSTDNGQVVGIRPLGIEEPLETTVTKPS